MIIGITSDTHGNHLSWQKALAGPFRAAELILHAGDILYHGPRSPLVAGYGPAELAAAINESPCPVIIAQGNCDSAVDQFVIDYPIQAPYAFVQIDTLRILVNHGDTLTQPEMVEQAKRFRADFFIFGHIHLPVLEKHDSVILLNPGSPALPKSPFPTVATIDTSLRHVCLLQLENSEIIEQTDF
jgi:uncharacterized protein